VLQFGALFLWQANCCLMYGGSFWIAYRPMGWVGSWVQVHLAVGWVGSRQIFGVLGSAGSMKVDPRTTLV